MTKELPYWQFMVGDWFKGDIQCCTHETKGIFVDLCSQLWRKGGYLPDDNATLATLCRCDLERFSTARNELEKWEILQTSNGSGVCVEFILEQLENMRDKHDKRAAAGRKGGNTKQLNRRSKARLLLEQKGSNALAFSDTTSESESETPPIVPKGTKKDEYQLRIDTLYNRRESTAWSDSEMRKYRKLKKRADFAEELTEIERLYNGGYEYRRKSISTLLNQWTGEVDKARTPAAEQPPAPEKRLFPSSPIEDYPEGVTPWDYWKTTQEQWEKDRAENKKRQEEEARYLELGGEPW
jgi:uncharacterized protein YdaU (DUF1376 family)